MEMPEIHGSLPQTPFGLTKVYMDYLPRSNEGLEHRLERFLDCGKIIKMLKKSGKTNGYIVFKKPNSVRLALTRNNKEFEGKRLRVELPKGIAHEGSAATLDGTSTPMERAAKRKGPNQFPDYQVYINRMAKPVNPEILRSVIGEEAPSLLSSVEQIKMMGEKNCCFVTLKSYEDVQRFCEKFNDFPLLGQNLQVLPAVRPGLIKEGGGIPDEYKLENYNNKKWEQPAKTEHNDDDNNENEDEDEDEEKEQDEWDKQVEEQPYEDAEEEDHEAAQERQNRDNTERQREMRRIGACSSILAGLFRDDVKQAELKDLFKKCGRILQLRLMRNRVTGIFTGVVSVKFDRPAAVYKALQMRGHDCKLLREGELSVDMDGEEVPQPKLPTPEPSPTPAPTPAPRRPARRGLVAYVAAPVRGMTAAVEASAAEVRAAKTRKTPLKQATATATKKSSKSRRKHDLDSDEELLDSDDELGDDSDSESDIPVTGHTTTTTTHANDDMEQDSDSDAMIEQDATRTGNHAVRKPAKKAAIRKTVTKDDSDSDAMVEEDATATKKVAKKAAKKVAAKKAAAPVQYDSDSDAMVEEDATATKKVKKAAKKVAAKKAAAPVQYDSDSDAMVEEDATATKKVARKAAKKVAAKKAAAPIQYDSDSDAMVEEDATRGGAATESRKRSAPQTSSRPKKVQRK